MRRICWRIFEFTIFHEEYDIFGKYIKLEKLFCDGLLRGNDGVKPKGLNSYLYFTSKDFLMDLIEIIKSARPEWIINDSVNSHKSKRG